MTATVRRIAVLLAFVTLFFGPVSAPAGEAEWQAHMKTGIAAYQRGDYRGASASFAAALKEAEAFGETDQRFATTINNLAVMYVQQGRYAEAKPLYRRSLAIREKALGPEHPDVGGSLNNLAGLYEAQGRYAEAEPLYRRTLSINEKALGADHPSVGTTLNRSLSTVRKWEIGEQHPGGPSLKLLSLLDRKGLEAVL